MAATAFESDPATSRLFVRAVNADLAVTYAALAAIAVVYFDYFITLPREIQYMWNKRIAIPKVLYFILKYWVMVHSVLWMSLNLDPRYTGRACNGSFDRNGMSCQLILLLSEAVSYYRVYAFSGKNRWLGIFFLLLFLVSGTLVPSASFFHCEIIEDHKGYAAVGFYFVHEFLKTVEFFDLPGEGMGCLLMKGNGFNLFLAAVGLLVGLTSATSVMIFIAVRRRKTMTGSNKLLRIFYQDGIFYFVSLFILSLLNIAIFLVAPPGMQLLFVQPVVHLSAVLSSRMILHLREWSARQRVIVYSVNASTGERWVTQDATFDVQNYWSSLGSPEAYVLRNLAVEK